MSNLAASRDYRKEQTLIKDCERRAVDALYDQIKSAQAQINTTGPEIADVMRHKKQIWIGIVKADSKCLHKPYSLTECGLTKALAYINQFVTV